ncbi:MAG: SWIM zinc finger family protein, partial [Lachnospiraceae bacterium]|nr:SWIM zinc finger family protein [Lachnospiraceae bacterium]
MNWRDLFIEDILEEGKTYIENGSFANLNVTGEELNVTIQGKKEYQLKITYKDGNVAETSCSCPYGASGMKCEHMAAACLLGEAGKVQAAEAEAQTAQEPEVAEVQEPEMPEETAQVEETQ